MNQDEWNVLKSARPKVCALARVLGTRNPTERRQDATHADVLAA
jgi:hypothetical protein